jgi:hypothetical protein
MCHRRDKSTLRYLHELNTREVSPLAAAAAASRRPVSLSPAPQRRPQANFLDCTYLIRIISLFPAGFDNN